MIVQNVPLDRLRAATDRALTNDPGGATAYGSAVGYVPLRRFIADRELVAEREIIVCSSERQAQYLVDSYWPEGSSIRHELDKRPRAAAVPGLGHMAAYVVGTPGQIQVLTKLAMNMYLSPNMFSQAVVYEYVIVNGWSDGS